MVKKTDARAVELRRQGYSYQAIAATLKKEGLTDKEWPRERVRRLMVRVAPELMGAVRVRLRLDRMVRRKDIVTNDD